MPLDSIPVPASVRPYTGNYASLPAAMLKPPTEGNRSVPISIEWQRDGTSPGFAVEFNAQSQRVVPISQISALYIDNSANISTVVVAFPDTNFEIVAPANSTGYYPVISNGVRFITYCLTIPTTTDFTYFQILNFLPPALALQSTGFTTPVAVTEVDTGPGLTGGPITTTGTVSLISPVAILNGGTGAGTAAGALANLGGAPLASPNFSGVPLVPTAAPGTSTGQAASTQFVSVSFAPLASPIFTGAPSLPTGAVGVTQAGTTNSTALATTAFSRAMLAARAAITNAPADPAGSSSTTTYTHCGYAALLTPQISGRVLIMFGGVMQNSTVGGGGSVSFRYGTGAAPVNGAAVTGTATVTQPQYFVNAGAATMQVPLTTIALVSGLTLGTQYWFDLIQRSQVSGTFNIFNSSNLVAEL